MGRFGPIKNSEVEDRPADVVAQALIVENKVTNRFWKLITLPLALTSPCCITRAVWCCSTCGLDRVGGRSELVCGDVGDDGSLARCVRGMPCSPAQVPGGAHGVTTRRASFHHLDVAAHPGASMFDCLTRPWVLGLFRLEKVQDVFSARCRPQSQQMMIWVREGPTSTDRDQARITDLREDHQAPM